MLNKHNSYNEKIMIKTLDRAELEKLLKINVYNDQSVPSDLVPWGSG